MQKKTTNPPAKTAKKKKSPVKKQDQKFSFKRLIMGEEKPDFTELEAGSTTVGSCWLAPLAEAGEGVNLSFIFKRQPKEKFCPRLPKPPWSTAPGCGAWFRRKIKSKLLT